MQQADFINTFQDIAKNNGVQGLNQSQSNQAQIPNNQQPQNSQEPQNSQQQTQTTSSQQQIQQQSHQHNEIQPENTPQNPVTEFTPPEISNTPNNIDIEDTWKILLEKLKMHITEREINLWYNGLYLEKIENGVAEFSSNNPMKKDWLLNNHRGIIRNKLTEIIGFSPDITITVRSAVNSQNSPSNTNPQNSQAQQASNQPNYEYIDTSKLGDQGSLFNGGQQETQTTEEQKQQEQLHDSRLNKKYTLRNFVVGGNNQLAYAVAEGVIKQPGTSYNPVFFHGPSGVGKTHLMQAIGNAMRTQNPMARIIYVPIETFMNELIEGIRTGRQEDFRHKYRATDLLIIDDIQFISTKQKTQEELFNTFNALYQDGKQIVIASDRPPKEIEDLPDRLRTRFEGGMVVDIQSPDLETRIAILRQKLAEYKDAHLTDEIVMFIAQNVENSVRELEGAITKVIAFQKFSTTPLSTDDIAKMLQVDIETKRKRIKPVNILNAVCEIFDLKSSEIKGKRRTAHVALARQTVMYLLREELEMPLERVAKEVNRTDHTTVLHACDKVEGLLENDERFKEKVDRVKVIYRG